MANPLETSQNNNPAFNPNVNKNWMDIWNDWAWKSQENNLFTSSGEVQFSEWAQQMLSTMYQNWYNSAPEQMKRDMEAGINPFIAASGIAGSDTGNVASPPPSTPNREAELLNAASNVGNMLGGSFGSVAGGISILSKLRPEIDKINAETQSIFESMGFTKLQSKALSCSLKYLDQKEQIGVWQALASFDKTKQEYQNLVAEHNNILAQYDEIIAHKDLLIQEQGEVEARRLVNEAMKGKIEEETRFIKADNEFFALHHYRLGTPVYDSLRDMMVSNGTFDMEAFGDTISGYEGKLAYAVSSNQFKADEETAYGRAHNAGMGSYDSDPYQQQYRELYDMVDTLSNQEQETGQLLSALKSAHDEGKISDEEYKVQQGKILKLQREIRKSSEALNKHLAKMNFSVGHSSQLQEIKGDLIKIGVAVGLYSVGKSSPTQIKGFTGR